MSLDTLEATMDALNVAPELRDRWRADYCRQNGISQAPTQEQLAAEEKRTNELEKAEQHAIKRILLACGFVVYNLSQPRATKQTAGLPDLYAVHKSQPICFWFEVKRSNGGRMSEEQQEFQNHMRRCHVRCYAGDRYELRRVLRDLGIKELV